MYVSSASCKSTGSGQFCTHQGVALLGDLALLPVSSLVPRPHPTSHRLQYGLTVLQAMGSWVTVLQAMGSWVTVLQVMGSWVTILQAMGSWVRAWERG